jgi:DNA polymerase-3 subunit delta
MAAPSKTSLTPAALVQSFRAAKPPLAVVLLGEDVYLRDLCRKTILEACVPAASRDWAVAAISAKEEGWDAALERARTFPMLSAKQLVILEDAEALESLGEDESSRVADSMAAYLADPAPFTILLIEARALDERRRFFKVLSGSAPFVSLSPDRESAAQAAEKMARDAGAAIEPVAAAALAEMLDGVLARVHMEIKKLALYAEGRTIALDDVERLVVAARRHTVWQLADMLAARRRGDALVFLDSLIRTGEQPAGIVGAVAWMYKTLVQARAIPAGASRYDAARILRMNPDRAELTIRNARQIPLESLLRGLCLLAEADNQLKSGAPNPSALMEFLIAELTSIPSEPRTTAAKSR